MNTNTNLTTEAKEKLRQLQEWIEVQKADKDLADIQFCPRDLREGNTEDYINDAYNMLLDYRDGKYTDISNLIL